MRQSIRIEERAIDLNVQSAFPSVVELQTTNVCNARCTCCPYVETTAEESKAFMSDELLWTLLEECAEHKDAISQMVPYHNNEPFLDKRMLDVLRFIKKEIRVPVEISSNCSALTEKISAVVVEEGLIDTLRISLFASDEERYEMRMKGLKWQRTMTHLTWLLQARQRGGRAMDVEIVMIATADLNAEEVHNARVMWEPYGARVHVFGYLDRAGSGRVKNLLPYNAMLSRVVGCDLNRPFERICVLTNGNTVLCSQDWTKVTNMGSVLSAGIQGVWQGDLYREYRETIAGRRHASRDFICRKCKLAIFE